MNDRKHRVLYIDDDRDYLDNIRVILESGDIEMIEATGAEEGLAVFLDQKPDLVLVDLMMEEIDSGINFVRELRIHHQDVPVFLLSSVGDSLGLTQDYTELGLAGFFMKPVDGKNLLNVINSKLNEQRSEL